MSKTEDENFLESLLQTIHPKALQSIVEHAQRTRQPVRIPTMRQTWSDFAIGEPFRHVVSFPVSGKADGKLHRFEVSASTPDRLLLFRSVSHVSITPSEVGESVMWMKHMIDGKTQGRWGGWPIAHMRALRVEMFDALHPRQVLEIDLAFAKDVSNATVGIFGTAIEVRNEGVFAFKPPAEPCTAIPPDEFTDPENAKVAVIQAGKGRRCDNCWHFWMDHATWPWREIEAPFSIEAVVPGEKTSAVVQLERPILAHSIILDDHNLGFRTDTFWTPGLFAPGSGLRAEEKWINLFGANVHVPRGNVLQIPVENRSSTPHPFKGKVHALELRT